MLLRTLRPSRQFTRRNHILPSRNAWSYIFGAGMISLGSYCAYDLITDLRQDNKFLAAQLGSTKLALESGIVYDVKDPIDGREFIKNIDMYAVRSSDGIRYSIVRPIRVREEIPSIYSSNTVLIIPTGTIIRLCGDKIITRIAYIEAHDGDIYEVGKIVHQKMVCDFSGGFQQYLH